jgi:hypothetical protein
MAGLLAAALSCASGCHLFFPFSVEEPGQQDAGILDRGADAASRSDGAPPDSAAVDDKKGPIKIEGGPQKVDATLPVIPWMKLALNPALPWPAGKTPSIYASSPAAIYIAVGDTLYNCVDQGKTLSCLEVPLPANLPPAFTLRDIGGSGSAVFVAGGPGILLSKQSGWQNIYADWKFDFYSVWCNGTAQCYLGAERQEFWPFIATSVLYKGGIFTPEMNNPTIPRFEGAWIGPAGSYRVLVGQACQIDQLTSTIPSGTSETPSGCTTNLHSVWGAGSSDVHAVGSGGARLRMYGGTWTVVHPEVAGAPALRAVWGFTSLDVYAVGDGGAVWYFDGSAWSQPPEPGKLTQQGLTDLWGFVSNGKQTLYVVGNAGTVLRFKEY